MAENGNDEPAVDRDAVREEMGAERLIHCYRQMLLIRRFEEKCAQAYQQKKIAGFLHLYIGQEAVGTGFFDHLADEDMVTDTYRCHGHALLKGLDPNGLMAELFGKVTGNVRGKGGSMHFFSKEKNFLGGHGIVGGQMPVGTGAGFACKYKETGGVSLTILGDGAVPTGSFHESLNLASLWELPVIYLIENNKYGMGTAVDRAVSVDRLAEDKAPAFSMKGMTVHDGLDLYENWKVAQEAFAYVRDEGKPVVIESLTYRYFGHSISDPAKYRTKDEVKEYRARDPLKRIGADLEEHDFASGEELDEWDEETRERIDEALQFAEESEEPPLSELMQHVYKE